MEETYSIQDFLEMAHPSEKMFYDLMVASDREVTYASDDCDIRNHWDIAYDGIRVDVKGLKKVFRSDPEVNENFHWVEFKNVSGKEGWLYGMAHQFAFETDEYFILVDKLRLQKFLASKCSKKEVTKLPALYKMYQRNGRKDWCILVKTLDLMVIADNIIVKPTN